MDPGIHMTSRRVGLNINVATTHVCSFWILITFFATVMSPVPSVLLGQVFVRK